MKTDFEIIGYSVDIYYRKKYYGCYTIEQPDRDVIGYAGRRDEILTENWIYKNKRIKAGSTVTTECYPLCGRMIGSIDEKIKRLSESKQLINP
tara:strand:+ start:150 stop:428 length:279 start_codon:yes stop_codon:yes gene_type:complete